MAESLARLQAWLAHHADPDGGAALLGLLAPEAPMPFRLEVAEARAIAPADFAETHRAILQDPLASTLPRFEGLRLHDERADGDRSVAWFWAEEALSGRTMAIGCGLVPTDAGLAIGWATLAEAPEPWSYALGLAQAVADWPYRGELAGRSWLDLAYRRLFAYETPPLQFLPEARFSCHSSTACCKVDYLVEVDAAFQRVIDAVPWEHVRPELAGIRLPVDANGRLQVKQDGQPCRFLDEHDHCSVHKALGRAVFPPCARFPFSFVETPDGVAVSASAICGSVRQNLGLPLSERQEDLYRRMAIARDAVFRPRTFKLMGGQPASWEAYREAEAALLGYLDRQTLAIDRRLWLGSALLANWHKGFREVPDALIETPIPVAADAERASMAVLLADFLRFFGLAEMPAVHRGAPLRSAATLARMVRHMLFSKLLSASFDLTTAHNLGILLWLLVLHLEAAQSEGVSEAQWEALGRLFMHGGILKALAGQGAADYREMFAHPEFGLWLLTYPLEAPCAAPCSA